MYASVARRFTVAVVLVAALSGILAAEVGSVAYPAVRASEATRDALPVLPEIVVTASRLEA